MAKWGESAHPNVLSSRMRPDAVRLNLDRTAALARIDEIASLRGEGLTLQQIGDRFGISRTRVYQILRALRSKL
jgi:predicted DNA-binding protein (UPF0251 family)